MKPRILLPLVAAVVAVTAAGCADDGAPGLTPTASGPSLTATPLTPESATSPTGSVPPEVANTPAVQAAVADLAGRLSVPTDAVTVVEVSEVTWPDGSLGCPEPGVNYTQALVNGQLVVLSVDGKRYEYHSGPNRPLFYCENPKPPVQSTGSGAGAQ